VADSPCDEIAWISDENIYIYIFHIVITLLL